MANCTVRVGRRTTVGAKVYGTGGEYEVDEVTAQILVNRGGKVLKGKALKKQEDTVLGRENDEDFMNRIRRNATEILGILQAEADKGGFEDNPVKGGGNGEEVETANEETEDSSSQDETTTDKTSDDQANGNGAEATADAAGGTNDADDSDLIPEDFPGREVLAKNNITKLSQIPRDKEELMKLEQMTGRVANQIGVKLGQGE